MAVTAPSAPVLAVVDRVSVLVSWTAGVGTNEPVSYRVLRDGVVVGTSSEMTFYDAAPARGELLSYTVRAISASGSSATSSPSTIVVAEPQPVTGAASTSAGSTPEVRILGSGSFAGSSATITSYSIDEDATPRSLTETGGGVGGISFSAGEDPGFDGSPALRGQVFEIYDPTKGVQQGVIDELSASNGELRVSAISLLQGLTARRTARAFSGSLANAFVYYFSLGGVVDGLTFSTQASAILSREVNLPRWSGEVLWRQIRKLASVHQLEISAVADSFLVRPLGQRTIDPITVESERIRYGNSQASSTVVIEYSAKEWRAGSVVYPDLTQSINDRPTISVDAGEVVTTNYPVNAYLENVEQPIHVLSLPPNPTVPSSSYAVLDRNDVPVDPNTWRNGGGEVTVAVGEDGRSIDVTVRGMITNSRAPYRIASGNQDWDYGALYVLGTGVFFEEREVWSATGASLDAAAADEVTRIEEQLIDTDELAITALANASLDLAGFSAELTMRTNRVNRRGETGLPVYPTFDDFDSDYPTQTFDQFDAEMGNITFDEFDLEQAEEVALDFRNQAFGGVAGARLRKRDAYYRIVTARIDQDGFDITAIPDSTFDEFDEAWEDATFDDFDALWGDATFEQFEVSPLAN